jgi:hypothetical protein
MLNLGLDPDPDPDLDRHQNWKSDPDRHQTDADPQHWILYNASYVLQGAGDLKKIGTEGNI